MVLKARFGKAVVILTMILAISLTVFGSAVLAGDSEKAKEYFNAGLTLSKEGNDSLATIEYKKAIEENPEFVDARINLGSIYFKQTKYSEAEAEFKKASEIAADNPDIWANLGRAYYKQKKYIESEESYRKALSLDKAYYEAYKDLGLLYYKGENKNWAGLVENMSVYTEHITNDHLAFYLLGKGYQKLKKYPEAIAAYNRAVEIKADYYNAFNSLGQIYQAQEKHMKAYQMYQKAVNAKPDSYLARYNLAISYETVHQDDQDKIDQIISYWSKFLKAAKSNPRAKSLVPGAEEHLKDLRELKTHYEEENTSKL